MGLIAMLFENGQGNDHISWQSLMLGWAGRKSQVLVPPSPVKHSQVKGDVED